VRVTFVLPFPHRTGGVRVVEAYAARLRRRGHTVDVLVPRIPFLFGKTPIQRVWLGEARRNLLTRRTPPPGMRFVPFISARFVPDADVVVATAWPTAYAVARLPARCGRGAYLIQHREIDSGPARLVDPSYELPLFRIAGSRHSAERMKHELGTEFHAVVPNGVDVPFWSRTDSAKRAGVLVPHLPGERKGAADGIAALERVRAARPDVVVRMFGPVAGDSVPAWVEYHARPDDERLRALYAASEVLLYPSRQEGFGLPPLEAMAAGCAVVTTRVGEVPEFAIQGQTALTVEPLDVAGMARAVLDLLDDPIRRGRIVDSARARVAAWDWEPATDRFEKALVCAARERPSPG